MSNGLFDLVSQSPAPIEEQPPQETIDVRAEYEARRAAAEKANELKESISRQIEQGNDPQYILYTAIRAIGYLTRDTEWQREQEKQLDSVYGDLAQVSFLLDETAIAGERLEEKRQQYAERMLKRLNNNLKDCEKIQTSIKQAMEATRKLMEEPQANNSQ